MKQLPTRQREVFLLRHFESLQFGQIASITGVSIGAIKAKNGMHVTELGVIGALAISFERRVRPASADPRPEPSPVRPTHAAPQPHPLPRSAHARTLPRGAVVPAGFRVCWEVL